MPSRQTARQRRERYLPDNREPVLGMDAARGERRQDFRGGEDFAKSASLSSTEFLIMSEAPCRSRGSMRMFLRYVNSFRYVLAGWPVRRLRYVLPHGSERILTVGDLRRLICVPQSALGFG